MKYLKWILLLMLTGCVHINKGTATADCAEIESHIKSQLHCAKLELHENNHDSFSGVGRNDTGEFTIEVTRKDDVLNFHGAYLDKSKGTFSGSASWSTHVNSGVGIHQTSESSSSSLKTP